jgi:hypothetical protein
LLLARPNERQLKAVTALFGACEARIQQHNY